MQTEIHHRAGAEGRAAPVAAQESRKRLRRALVRELGVGASRFAVPFEQAAEVLGGTLLLEVDPSAITQQFRSVVAVEGRKYRVADFFVGGGDWTGFLRPVRKFEVHRAVKDMLRAGPRFADTESYRRMVARMEAGNPDSRPDVLLDSVEKIDHYFASQLALIDSIRKHGVRRRRLGGMDGLAKAATGPSRPLLGEIVERDIGIALGADGSLYRLCSGQHRFAIAQLLGIRRVPAEIRLVHLDWLGKVASETGLNPLAAVGMVVKRAGLGHKPGTTAT